MSPLLSVSEVSKRFGGIQALSEVSLSVEAGHILGLVGANGSGKSTLLGIIAGRIRPDAGTIAIDGTEHSGLSSPIASRRLGIEFMPQEIAIVDDLTVTANVCLGDEPRRLGVLDAGAARQSAASALRLIGLQLRLDARAAELSTAEKRMLMLARTLHRKTKVVIIDEPTAGLAPADAMRVCAAVRNIRDSGTAVIYVSHFLEEVAELVDEAIGLRDGRVVSELLSGEVTRSALLNVILGPSTSGKTPSRPAPAIGATGGGVVLSVGPLRAGHGASTILDVRQGEVVGLAGLLGSGRAHMVEVMTAVRSSSDEPVFVRGVRVRDPLTAFQAGLGHLSGDRAQCVIPTLDLHAHVTLPVLGRFRRCGIVRRPSEVTASKRALADVGVNSPARYLSELSGGNQQRALLARWLLADVEVLVADEPTVGVDVKARGLILDDLREFGHRKALVLSSSEPEELAAICDRVLCFRDGAVVAEVSGEALTTSAILNAIT